MLARTVRTSAEGLKGFQRRALATLTKAGALSPYHSTAPLMSEKEMKKMELERSKKFEQFKAKAQEQGAKLDFMCGAVIERLPVLLPDLDSWEVDFLELQEQQNLKKMKILPADQFSRKSGHDGNLRKDDIWALELLSRGTNGRLGPLAYDDRVKAFMQKQKKGDDSAEAEVSQTETSKSAAIEKEQVQEEEEEDDILSWSLQMDVKKETDEGTQKSFRPNPRETEADTNNDSRSLRRRLQRRLYLIIKVNDPSSQSSEPVWRFPMGVRSDGEVLLDTAVRSTAALCGSDLDLYYLARIPAGYSWMEYNNSTQKERDALGAQVFFFRGQRLGGQVKHGKDVLDYAWVTNDEIDQLVDNIDQDPYWSYARLFMED